MYSVGANGLRRTALNWDVIDEMYIFYWVATILVSSCIIRGICSFQRLLMSGIHRFLIYSLLLLGKQNFSNGHLRDRMNLIKEKLPPPTLNYIYRELLKTLLVLAMKFLSIIVINQFLFSVIILSRNNIFCFEQERKDKLSCSHWIKLSSLP